MHFVVFEKNFSVENATKCSLEEYVVIDLYGTVNLMGKGGNIVYDTMFPFTMLPYTMSNLLPVYRGQGGNFIKCFFGLLHLANHE